MTHEDVALSQEQREKLENGETVKLGFDHLARRIDLHPPCKDEGHDWIRHDIRVDDDGDSHYLKRRCKVCGHTESNAIDPDWLFELARMVGEDRPMLFCECGRSLDDMWKSAGGRLMMDCPEHGVHEWGDVEEQDRD